MRVIDIARKADVTPDTVRHYTRLGILRPSRNRKSGYKIFDQDDYACLLFIRNARALGMSVADTQTIVNAARKTHAMQPEIACLFRTRIDELRRHIRTLKRLERQFAEVLREWEQLPRGSPTGDDIAKLINSWGAIEDK